jgi:hypothetical protein
VKVHIGKDEFTLYFLSPEADQLGGRIIIDLLEHEFADYERVISEFDAWQTRISGLVKG